MESPANHAELLTATVLLDIALVLAVGTLVGRWVGRLRQPAVIGEVLAGVALGPSLLGLLPGNPTAWLFPAEARPFLSTVAQVGLALFMFLIGWEFDPARLRSHRGTAAAVSIGSIVVSFGLGVALATLLYHRHDAVGVDRVGFTEFALFLGVAMSITAFPVLARILAERGLTGTRVGSIALVSAAIDDVLAWCLLAVVTAIVTASGPLDLVRMLLLLGVFLTVLRVVVRPLLVVMTRRWATTYLLVTVVATVFLASYATTWIGLHAIFGAFCVGLVMPRQPAAELREQVCRPLEHVSMVLLPVFFIVTGLGVDIGGLTAANLLELAAIVLVACVGKLTGAIVPAVSLGMSWRDAGILGILVNTRGLTELVVLSVGLQLGVLDGQMFTMLVLMALVTTALAGPLIRSGRTPATRPGEPDTADAAMTDARTGGTA
ncbi:cation:proton antiporter [Micromonospora rifamycinica]|uniref:Kef-type K+ transport system, membrane component KefB n=1 Tax=Micromonospora rifamycinica TaxID=291594 RepID=A0A109INX7_9ACTN|nr:cation:proton antiporter [Micromonospora rifamycinica]KWV34014.1 sodium:proton exchanger [Micromonospora rifamycinica]SCG47674.1 Kef-type K+ transport system, membrane component KefB [Micromonospora rifamycinica]